MFPCPYVNDKNYAWGNTEYFFTCSDRFKPGSGLQAILANVEFYRLKYLARLEPEVESFSLSGGFTPCWHLRPSSGQEHTVI